MFIGREKELQFLEDRYNRPEGQLVILYGRRRVGKTETLCQFCRGKRHVFFSCRECTDKMQLQMFSRKMFEERIPASQYIHEFTDWEQAFKSITDLPFGSEKKLIVIDEFPYMCKGNNSIPSILQNLWDEGLKDENVMIILCGSSMSFIEKELLAEKNPLYGRATGIYKMEPMGFYDAIKFFPTYSERDKIFVYSILGGVPHYLRQFDPEMPLAENIRKNILTKGCALYSEVEFLLRQELRETSIYNTLIETIAQGSTKLNDISQKSMIENTAKTSVYLKNLMELGIVEREFSVDAGSKEKSNYGRGIYKLTDHFFRFWYAFVFTNLSELENGDVDGVYEYIIAPELHRFASFTFEEICHEFVRELQKEEKLPFRYYRMGRWFGKTTIRDSEKNGLVIAETEIDILATDRNSKKYLVGECKFKNKPFSFSEYLDTAAKLTPYQKNAEFYYALFAENGFEEGIAETAGEQKNIFLYSMEDIVNLDAKGRNI